MRGHRTETTSSNKMTEACSGDVGEILLCSSFSWFHTRAPRGTGLIEQTDIMRGFLKLAYR